MPESNPFVVPALIAAIFGLLVGSFANVVIYRLPLRLSIVFPSSRCPNCLAAIRPWQNIPIVSWCLLRGRCASCRAPISIRYPLVEALHGIGFAMIVMRFGVRPYTPFQFLFFSALVILAFIDWDHLILPDVITLPGIVIGVLSSQVPGTLVDWNDSIIAAIAGYLTFWLLAGSYMRLRGVEGLGQGDWKLAAMMGAFTGMQRLMLTVFLGSLLGVAYGLVQTVRRRYLGKGGEPGHGEEATPFSPVHAVESTTEPRVTPPGPPMESPSLDDATALAEPLVPSDAPESVEGIDDALDELDEPAPIGQYKLPFGTFLAVSAIVVLLYGHYFLVWYGSLLAGSAPLGPRP